MKKSLFVVVAAFLLLSLFSCGTTSHNSRNSADWAGIYTGVTPSASGEGINVKFTLNADETYTLEYRYVGRSDEVFTSTGKFTWNSAGDTIILAKEGEADFPSYYKVGENTLTQLDLAGNVITGDLAAEYVLRKQ